MISTYQPNDYNPNRIDTGHAVKVSDGLTDRWYRLNPQDSLVAVLNEFCRSYEVTKRTTITAESFLNGQKMDGISRSVAPY